MIIVPPLEYNNIMSKISDEKIRTIKEIREYLA